MVCSQPLCLLLRLKCLQHNVKRVRYSSEAVAAKKEREKARLKEFQTLTGEVLPRVRSDRAGPSAQGLYTRPPAQKQSRDYSKEAFDLTTRLLQANPEFYTIWNYRRNILVNGIFPSRYAWTSYMSSHRVVIRARVCIARLPKSTMFYPMISPSLPLS